MNPYAGSADNFPATVFLPDDSDPPMAATFNPAPQGLADRTMSLANGYVANLADIATLKAIDTTTIPDGAVRSVKGFGVFILDKTTHPTWTEDLPMVVAPTTGTGRWFSQDESAASQYEIDFTIAGATATWNAPPNLSFIEAELVGGAGGGGGGAGADTSASDAPGGGGGARGRRVVIRVAVTGAAAYDVTPGSGGTGGAAAAEGSDGENSSIAAHLGAVIAKAAGGQGGSPGTTGLADIGSAQSVTVPGGASATATPKTPGFASVGNIPFVVVEGGGGWSGNSQMANLVSPKGAANGGTSDMGQVGGTAGSRGANNTHLGGTGGGGGGGGMVPTGGSGGNGGAGGAGAASGAGANGNAGSDAIGNTGAGGGGGGGGGAGTLGSSGGPGGKGADGFIRIRGVR